MILDGFKFSINFLKDNFSQLLLIISLPFILELAINSISVFYLTNGSSFIGFISGLLTLLIQTWAQCILIFYIHNHQANRSISDMSIYTLYKLPYIILWGLFVGLLVALGILLLVLPGIYIALRYSFYTFEILLSQKKIHLLRLTRKNEDFQRWKTRTFPISLLDKVVNPKSFGISFF